MNSNSLLKGTLSPIILKLLAEQGQMYGYQLIQSIRERSGGHLHIKEGALYPALHKLEQQGFLEVEHRQVSGRVRKYYRLGAKGRRATEDKLSELKTFVTAVQSILEPKTKLS